MQVSEQAFAIVSQTLEQIDKAKSKSKLATLLNSFNSSITKAIPANSFGSDVSFEHGCITYNPDIPYLTDAWKRVNYYLAKLSEPNIAWTDASKSLVSLKFAISGVAKHNNSLAFLSSFEPMLTELQDKESRFIIEPYLSLKDKYMFFGKHAVILKGANSLEATQLIADKLPYKWSRISELPESMLDSFQVDSYGNTMSARYSCIAIVSYDYSKEKGLEKIWY